MEFKPGLILSAIFKDKSLILKNISKVKTSVLERFNELFSDKNIITLSEDTTNTFTSEDNKELKGFKNFKIIATSSLNDQITLSESILSRFSIINVEDYNEKEKTIVLNKKADKEEKLIEEIKPNLTLAEKLNSIKISKRLDNYRPHSDHNKNLKLVFYIYENGKKERKDNNDDEKYKIYKFKDNENPFEENIDDKKLISKRTQLSIDFNNFNYKDPNIYFTTKFSEICDLVHFSCATHVPLVLEGDSGQGKKKQFIM